MFIKSQESDDFLVDDIDKLIKGLQTYLNMYITRIIMNMDDYIWGDMLIYIK